MRKTVLYLLGLWTLLGAEAFAAPAATRPSDKPLGIGIVLGEPSGFSGRYDLSSHHAINMGIAWSFSSFLIGHADYLWVFPQGFMRADAKDDPEVLREIHPYVGAGIVLMLSTDQGRRDGKLFTSGGQTFGAGVRIPLGMEWRPGDPPLGVFLEVAPGVGFVPNTFAFFQGGIGVRLYL